MQEPRRATTTGLLFLIATMAALAGNALLKQPVEAGISRVAAGALLELVAAGTSASIAVSMYERLRTWGAGAALGSVILRAVEAVLYAVGTAASLAARAVGANLEVDRQARHSIGMALAALREQAILAGVFAFCAGAGLYYLLLLRARLVPRWLSAWGIAGIAMILAASVLALFVGSSVPTFWPLVVPIALQEMALAAWLLLRGFQERVPRSG